PNYICCVLTVRDELINENRALVQQLVDYVQGAGTWLDQAPANRAKAVQIAAGPKFFNQDPNVLQFVMDNPSDRVTYGDLRLIKCMSDDARLPCRSSKEACSGRQRLPGHLRDCRSRTRHRGKSQGVPGIVRSDVYRRNRNPRAARPGAHGVRDYVVGQDLRRY